MKCAVFKGAYQFEIEERDIPQPREGEVLVKVMACGICGSDIHPYMGDDPANRRKPGLIMGHEAAGIVEDAGGSSFKKGDRVAINPQVYCGECPMCAVGEKNICDDVLVLGSSKNKFLDGAMCQYIALKESQLIPLPDNVSFAQGAMLDPVGNAFHVMRRGGVAIGDTVAIIGCGAIGLIAVQAAKLSGAVCVIAVDTDAKKLALAAEYGADICRKPDDPELAGETLRATRNIGADVVIEAVGIVPTYRLAARLCKKQGTIVALGFSTSEMSVPLVDIIFSEKKLVGSTGFVAEGKYMFDLMSKGLIKLDKIITHEFPLEQTKEGFDTLCGPSKEAIKVMILPNN